MLLVKHGVVAFLCLGRWNVAEGLQQPAIVEPVDLGQRRELDGFEASPRPTPVNDLGLVEPVDRLGEGVVIAVADTADGWLDARFRQPLGVANADVLRPAIRVVHRTAAMIRPPFMQGPLQGVQDEAGMGRPAYAPTHIRRA